MNNQIKLENNVQEINGIMENIKKFKNGSYKIII